MTQAPSENTQPYPWAWLGVFSLFVLGLIYLMFIRPQIPYFEARRLTVSSSKIDTYLIVHFPPVYSKSYSAPEKAEAWIAALTSKGYQPALLSDVHRWVEEGKGLPEKTVVILFDPSSRATFEVMAPLLKKYKFPAVWITDGKKHAKNDTQYVSAHVLRAMKKSKFWDIGRYEGDSRIVIEPFNSKPFFIGTEKGAWKVGAGRHALNRGISSSSLNRLHVNWNWTDRNIIDRLQAEEPLRGKGALTLKKIINHNWGVVLPESSSQEQRFSLKAPIDSRSAHLSWLGTKWNPDAKFDMTVRGLTGELWLLLRSDETIGENVGVCFLNGKLSITRQTDHKTQHLADILIPSLSQPGNFSASVVINGPDLTVHINGKPAARVNNLPEQKSRDGIVRLTVYDKILGAAQAESVSLNMIQLEHNSEIVGAEQRESAYLDVVQLKNTPEKVETN